MVSNMTKIQTVQRLWVKCQQCDLSAGRTNVAFFRGNPDAKLGIVGEAPGLSDVVSPDPFIGGAGEMLDLLCDRAGVEPWDTLVLNLVACRPPGDRKPNAVEIEVCRTRFASTIVGFRPRALLLLGARALTAVAGDLSLRECRGMVVKTNIPWRGGAIEIDAVPTLHPAYVLQAHNEALERIVIQDIRLAFELSQGGSYLEGD